MITSFLNLVSANGSFVWTLGSSSICIWSSISKQYIGQLQLDNSSDDFNSDGLVEAGDRLNVPGAAMLGRIGKKIITTTSSSINRTVRTMSASNNGSRLPQSYHKVIGIEAAGGWEHGDCISRYKN